MNNVLLKDTWRTIERTRSRFISLIAIVALGVSFFAGVNAAAPDMLDTAKEYYRDSNIMDIQIISTAGLTGEDVAVISSIQGVETVEGVKSIDGVLRVDGEKLSEIDGSELTVRAIGLDMQKAVNDSAGLEDPTYLNRPQLVDGAWPTQLNQCVVEADNLSAPDEFQIGATVSIEGAGTDIAGSLQNTEYTVVGIIRTPLYISYDRGTTQIGTGKLGTFFFIPQENFKTDYYSSLSIKLAGSEEMDPYSEEYRDFVKPYADYITSIANQCLAPRVVSLREQYTSMVNKGEVDYARAKEKTDATIKAAEAKVATILDMAENGDAKLAEFKRQYNEKAQEASQKIDASKLEHSTQYAAWEQKRAEYLAAKAQIEQYTGAETDLKNAQTEYNVANLQVNSLMTTIDYLEQLIATTRGAMTSLDQRQGNDVSGIINRFEQSGLVGAEVDQIMAGINSLTAVGTAEEMAAYLEPQLQNLEIQLAGTKQQLSETKTVLAQKKVELDSAKQLVGQLGGANASLESAKAQLDEAEKELTNANADIRFGELEVLSQLSDYKNQISNYETNLQLAKAKAGTAREEFETQREAAYKKLEDAKNQLDHAKAFLLDLDTAKWYVNDRDDALRGYEDYKGTADRTAAIAIIFPWFFFIVSTLVSLNTMTRMVEDERTQLGTLKALGFRDREIERKYLIYALAASVIGGVAGSLLGFALFPTAINFAYGIMFELPALIIKYRPVYAIPGILISVGTTVLAAYGASHRSLTAVASTLMRPKAPKGGKRVFLERFPTLWSSLSFTWKVTFRNVFRNKKRFVMAVIGVFGCAALLVAAFGLDKSINTSLEEQFTNEDSIFRYDMQIVTNGSYDLSLGESDALNFVRAQPEIAMANLTYMKVYNTTSDHVDKDNPKLMETYLLVPDDGMALPNYFFLRDYYTGEPLDLPQNGAVVTRKLAKTLKIGVGDSITVLVDSDNAISVPVAAIAENYIFHYVYMTKEVYAAVFGANPQFNYVTANLAYDLDGAQKQALSQTLIGDYTVSALAYQDDIQASFENIFNALGYIVLVLVLSAAMLSLVVMYNLSSINIHERMKEIATIKVLGFTPGEVATYIFRENMLLSVIGTVIGLLLGIGLHRLVLLVGEVDIIMFGRNPGIMSFVYATLLSLGFTMLVNLVLMRNLRKIDMVESLKSIE